MRSLKLEYGSWLIDEAAPLGLPGGFGSVYVGGAQNGRKVAIKLIRHDAHASARRELRFARGLCGERLQHVIPILDFGEDAATGCSVVVMEKADTSLREYLSARGRIDEAAVRSLLVQVATGLVEADFIHRDLKPGNILSWDGRWCLADFGIAREANATTSLQSLKGWMTEKYAAPEQWNNERATVKTDVYSLGCVGAEALMGRPLFPGPGRDDYAEQHRHITPSLDDVSPRLRIIIARMVAKTPNIRPDPTQLIGELQAIESSSATPAGSAMHRLAAVTARVIEQKTREQAELAVLKEKARIREELSKEAIEVLRAIRSELFRRLAEIIPNIRDHFKSHNVKTDTLELTFGGGGIGMTVGEHQNLRLDHYQSYGLDIICADKIGVATDSNSRSAALWFGDIGDGAHRWREISFYRPFQHDANHEPTSQPPSSEVLEAFVPPNPHHEWHLAHPPRLIDGEHAEAFLERWLGYFADAAADELKPVPRLPENE